MRLVSPGKRAKGEISITGFGGRLPGCTLTPKLHWLELPEPSVVEQMTVCSPSPKTAPEAGLHTAVPAPEQLSETCVLNVTTLVQASWALVTTISAGQVRVGGSVSSTMISAMQ